MYTQDDLFLPFSNLMQKHVFKILLICSEYDRFMIEEDSRVEEELFKEYTSLGLTTPPKIVHAPNEEKALELIKTTNFDLVITMIKTGTTTTNIVDKVKEIKPDMPVVVLATLTDNRQVKILKEDSNSKISELFYYQGDASLFLAMVKSIEDALNVEHDTSIAGVQVIILIEDSIRFISSYLPLMYRCLIKQNKLSILDSLNEWSMNLRMRGRPKILLAKTGEEGMAYYNKYKKNVLGIITDVDFPYKGQREGSGLKLAKEIREDNENVSILIQSKAQRHEEQAKKLNADFIWKDSPSLLSYLEDHLINSYKFGEFKFVNPETKKLVKKVNTLKRLQQAIKDVDIDVFLAHSKQNEFSKWIRARGLFELADEIKNENYNEADGSPEEFRSLVFNSIKNYRASRTKGVIAQFSDNTYDETTFFSRMGTGSLGGKGRGLAFIHGAMFKNKIQEEFPEVYLAIPRTVVITTSYYDEFFEAIAIDTASMVLLSDDEILKIFLSYPLPFELRNSLRVFLTVVSNPITVRSSSLLEDSHAQPFAGVYQTTMLQNNGSDEKRLDELEKAIKSVWASVFFEKARDYLAVADKMVEEEKMAVVLQQVTGSLHGDYYYPNVSGVARSFNYYPIDNQKSEDGIAMVSFGFGKAVVDAGDSFRFSPAKPKKPSNSLTGEGFNQAEFYALNMKKEFDPSDSIDNLELLKLAEAEKYPNSLKYIASTIDMNTGMLSESVKAQGVKILTFNGMLKYDMFPLAKVINRILKLGRDAFNSQVEIEFAINTERPSPQLPDFSILQIRPTASLSNDSDFEINDWEKEDSYIYSTTVMGNGVIEDIQDIVMINIENFNSLEMINMASELASLNKKINKDYVLVASGRLGSSDPHLGIPCTWSDISSAKVIVETGLENMQVEPSQGTHFFQNLTSLGCVYLTINPYYNDGLLNFEKIANLEVVDKLKYFTHYRCPNVLDIRVNGIEKKAIITDKKQLEVWE